MCENHARGCRKSLNLVHLGETGPHPALRATFSHKAGEGPAEPLSRASSVGEGAAERRVRARCNPSVTHKTTATPLGFPVVPEVYNN